MIPTSLQSQGTTRDSHPRRLQRQNISISILLHGSMIYNMSSIFATFAA